MSMSGRLVILRSFSRPTTGTVPSLISHKRNLRLSAHLNLRQLATTRRNVGFRNFASAAAAVAQPKKEEAAVPEDSPKKLTVSPPTGEDKVFDPKLVKIVNEIAGLTLLEVAELNECLKKRLNIPDQAPMMMPMMAGGGMGGGQGGAAQEEEEVTPQKVQTSFTLKLIKFDDGKKVALIKEVKALLEGMNLVQAKKFVESAPTIIKADISKEEAEKLSAAFTAVGATCEIA